MGSLGLQGVANGKIIRVPIRKGRGQEAGGEWEAREEIIRREGGKKKRVQRQGVGARGGGAETDCEAFRRIAMAPGYSGRPLSKS